MAEAPGDGDHAVGYGSRAGSAAEQGAPGRMVGMVQEQALVTSFADIFLLPGAIFAALVPLVPLVAEPAPEAAARGGH